MASILIAVAFLALTTALIAADPRVAELDRYDAELQKMIQGFRATHLDGVALPPDILQMQEQIRQQRLALGVGSLGGNTGTGYNFTPPSPGRTVVGGVQTMPSITTKQQAVLGGIQNIGNIFQNVIDQHLQDQQRQAQEEEEEEMEHQRFALQAQQIQMQEQIRTQQQQIQKVAEARAKEQLVARPLFDEPLSSFYGDAPVGNLDSQNTAASQGWLGATVEPDVSNARDAAPPGWLEATLDGVPIRSATVTNARDAAPLGWMDATLDGVPIRPASTANETTTARSDWREATLGGIPVTPASSTKASGRSKPEDAILEAGDGLASSVKTGSQTKEELRLIAAARALHEVRSYVFSKAADDGKEASMGMSPVLNSWSEYTETVFEEHPLGIFSVNPLKKAAEKVKESWRTLLKESIDPFENFTPK